jgi:hypothetical protein
VCIIESLGLVNRWARPGDDPEQTILYSNVFLCIIIPSFPNIDHITHPSENATWFNTIIIFSLFFCAHWDQAWGEWSSLCGSDGQGSSSLWSHILRCFQSDLSIFYFLFIKTLQRKYTASTDIHSSSSRDSSTDSGTSCPSPNQKYLWKGKNEKNCSQIEKYQITKLLLIRTEKSEGPMVRGWFSKFFEELLRQTWYMKNQEKPGKTIKKYTCTKLNWFKLKNPRVRWSEGDFQSFLENCSWEKRLKNTLVQNWTDSNWKIRGSDGPRVIFKVFWRIALGKND